MCAAGPSTWTSGTPWYRAPVLMVRIDRIDPPEASQAGACSAQTGGPRE